MVNEEDYSRLIKALSDGRAGYVYGFTTVTQFNQIIGSLQGTHTERIEKAESLFKEAGIDTPYESFCEQLAKSREALDKGELVAFYSEAEQIKAAGIDDQVVDKVKQSIKVLLEIRNKLSSSNDEEIKDKLPSEDELKNDLACFFIYVAAQDGVIKDDEISVGNKLFDLDLTAEYWQNLLDNNDEYFDYQNHLPESALALFSLSKKIDKRDKTYIQSASCASNLMRLFSYLGLVAASSDGEASQDELAFVEEYIKKLNKYFCENASIEIDIDVDYDVQSIKHLRLKQITDEELKANKIVDSVTQQIEQNKKETDQTLQQTSFSGLSGAFNSFELTKLEKEKEANLKQLQADLETTKWRLAEDKETYADAKHVLANYQTIVPSLEETIVETQSILDILEAPYYAALQVLDDARDELNAVKDAMERELYPYQNDKERIESRIEQEKERITRKKDKINDLRYRNDEEDEERRRTEEAIADLERDVRDCENDLRMLEDELRQTERDIDDIESRYKSEMAPLEAAVEEAHSVYDPLADKWCSAKNTNERAKERLDYCNYLVAHPEELNDLASAIKDKETSIVNQEAIIEGAEKEQKRIKQAAETSREYRKIFLVIAAITAVILFLVVSSGGCSTQNSHSSTSSSSSSSSSYSTTTSGSSTSNSSSNKSTSTTEIEIKSTDLKATKKLDGIGTIKLPDYRYQESIEDDWIRFSSPSFFCGVNSFYADEDLLDMKPEDKSELNRKHLESLKEEQAIEINNEKVEFGEIKNVEYEDEKIIGSFVDVNTDAFNGRIYQLIIGNEVIEFLFSWPSFLPGEEYAEYAIESFKPTEV